MIKILQPLKFSPYFKYRIWGGAKLKTLLNKDFDSDFIGESWEISQVHGNVSLVSEGTFKDKYLTELIKDYGDDLLGKKVYREFGNNFPLLIKFLDAKLPLSIQVHPSNEVARKRHNSFAKNEMWYIMESDKDASVFLGWRENTDKEKFAIDVKENRVLNSINKINASEGDCFYVPAGVIHGIGKGCLIAEIQQTSDFTYRIYDYDRVDEKTGSKRELHLNDAFNTLNFDFIKEGKITYKTTINKPKKLIHSPYFKTNIIELNGRLRLDYKHRDSFTIFISVKGNAIVNGKELNYGETILIPNALNEVFIDGDAKILEVFL